MWRERLIGSFTLFGANVGGFDRFGDTLPLRSGGEDFLERRRQSRLVVIASAAVVEDALDHGFGEVVAETVNALAEVSDETHARLHRVHGFVLSSGIGDAVVGEFDVAQRSLARMPVFEVAGHPNRRPVPIPVLGDLG